MLVSAFIALSSLASPGRNLVHFESMSAETILIDPDRDELVVRGTDVVDGFEACGADCVVLRGGDGKPRIAFANLRTDAAHAEGGLGFDYLLTHPVTHFGAQVSCRHVRVSVDGVGIGQYCLDEHGAVVAFQMHGYADGSWFFARSGKGLDLDLLHASGAAGTR